MYDYWGVLRKEVGMLEWQEELKNNINGVEALSSVIKLNEEEQRQMEDILALFPLSITPYYFSLIDFTNEYDPIKKMAIPTIAEMELNGSLDTSGEAENTVLDGLQHKYDETVMMISTNQCAMYCRHCFRRRFVGSSDAEIAHQLDDIYAYIMDHREINNILISGGDALLNNNKHLNKILALFSRIDHVDVIRIASRVPVVFPSRILSDELLQDMLAAYAEQKQIFFITQFNHPKEITEQSSAAIKTILKLGIPVKNQTVLLRGINDDDEVLGTLLRKLVSIGVDPYYVFQCRPVAGIKNQFQVPLRKGLMIVQQAKAKQNGLGKSFRYCMSHVTGKLEILGFSPQDEMLFQYHEAHNPQDLGKILAVPVTDTQTWLDDKNI